LSRDAAMWRSILVGSEIRVLSEGYRVRLGMTKVSKDDLGLGSSESLSCSSLRRSGRVSLPIS